MGYKRTMHGKRTTLILSDIVGQLKKLRLAKGISHDTLAALAGISRPAVSHIENGRRKPTLLLTLKLAHALDTELSEILNVAEAAYPLEGGADHMSHPETTVACTLPELSGVAWPNHCHPAD